MDDPEAEMLLPLYRGDLLKPAHCYAMGTIHELVFATGDIGREGYKHVETLAKAYLDLLDSPAPQVSSF